LFHRIKVVAVTLPPLRERREDLPLLCKHFIEEFNRRHGKKVTGMSEAVRKAFNAYGWPGNVRELRNTIESMVVLDRDGVLDVDDLQDSTILATVPAGGGTTSTGGDVLVGRPMAEVERFYIEKTLERTEGNREEAAKLLGIGERTLYRNMQEWKFQDQVRAALANHKSLAAAASSLNLKPEALARKIKKWGWPVPE